MFRTVAMTVLAMSAGAVSDGMASEPGKEIPAAESMVSQSGAPQSKAAAELARTTLARQLKIAESDITMTAIEPKTWSDSSMGCGRPGTLAMQVITEGYAVSLLAQGRTHRVNVSGASAVVCDHATLTRNELRRPSNARGLDVMIEKARQDLAQRLGVDPSAIRLQGTQPHQWADSGLDCPRAGETVVAGPINGYRLSLKHNSRIYSYHSDMKDVRACPAIEAQ